ncbi:MAG: PRC-barrel domain-containing protein [Rhodobacteraceae bacterium]|nr:PRC-barrel domain-containing protein [Paracoccaceae bacterium]
MKNLMISTAMAALFGTSALAQDTMFRASADPMEIHASEFIGKRVYASEAAIEGDAFDGLQDGWEDIGEINDVIVSRNGTVDAVLVDIGGFLGIGERQVAVDMKSIRFVADSATPEDESDYFLVMNASRAAFEEAPAYSWTHSAMQETKAAGEAVAEAAGDAGSSVKEAASDTAAAVADTAEAAGDAMTREHTARDGYETPPEADITTEMLTGASAYDANDERIGEVSRLIVDDSGKLTHAIVDVGGFLGIGEKPVELAMSDIDILRETGGDDLRVYIPMTKEQLEALPTYDK